jgi:hypothetical protein
MLEAEKEGGMDASLAVLVEFLEANGASLAVFNETMKKLNA